MHESEPGDARNTGEVESYSKEGSSEFSGGGGEVWGVVGTTFGFPCVSEQSAGMSVALGWSDKK